MDAPASAIPLPDLFARLDIIERDGVIAAGDGQRFLINTPTGRGAASQFSVVVGWPTELLKK